MYIDRDFILQNKLGDKNEILESYYPGFFEETMQLKIDGQSFGFSGPELINYFKNDTVPMFREVEDSYRYAIDKNLVIPIYMTRGTIREFLYKVFSPFLGMLSGIQAFYTSEVNRIFILISNISGITGHIQDEFLRNLIAHEFCHYMSYNFNKKYYSLFNKTLKTFYTYFFSNLFQNNVPLNTLKGFLKNYVPYMVKIEHKQIDLKILAKHVKKIYSYLDKLLKAKTSNDKLVSSRIELLKKAIDLCYMKGDPYTYYYECSEVFDSLDFAYKKIGVDPGNSFLFQELIFQSEVVAITNQHKITSAWYKLFADISKSRKSMDVGGL